MIDYVQIRNDILAGLRSYLRQNTEHNQLLVNESNQKGKEPERPYLIFSFTSPYVPEGVNATEKTELVSHPEPEWDHDIKYSRISNDTMSCSFTVNGQNPDQTINIGLLAQEWFKFTGLDYLKSKGLVVVECMELQNRDTYAVDNWERRQGFDVIFRVLGEIERTVKTIESVDISEGE